MEKETAVMNLPESGCESSTIKTIGWASLALGVAAIGVVLGRELRQRYKFKRRTPYDFYSHAGDRMPIADYGMGV